MAKKPVVTEGFENPWELHCPECNITAGYPTEADAIQAREKHYTGAYAKKKHTPGVVEIKNLNRFLPEKVAGPTDSAVEQKEAREAVKTSKSPVPVGERVRLCELAPGQRFMIEPEGWPGRRPYPAQYGYFIYATAGRARVEMDKAPETRTFVNKRTGAVVELTSSSPKQLDYTPDLVVKVLEGMRETPLLSSKVRVQREGELASSNSEQEAVMANKKGKTAAKKSSTKKTNGEAGRGRKPLSLDTVIHLKKGPTDESIKRHVDFLTTLKEDGKGGKMTLGELAKAFTKRVKTKQDPVKVFGMHRKALVDGGFITVTEPSA